MPKPLSQHLSNLARAVAIGSAGGALSGFAIGVIGGALSPDRGEAGGLVVGLLQLACLGAYYGTFVGALAVPAAYPILLHRTGFAIAAIPAFIGTVGGGSLGLIVDPDSVVLVGLG